MLKRFFTLALILMLVISAFGTSLAEVEQHTFSPFLAPELDSFISAGTAVNSKNRASTAATLMFDYVIYQTLNDIELETRALWHDCVIGRNANLVSVVYDLGNENILLIVYDTFTNEAIAGCTESTLSIGRHSMESEGYSVYTVDGTEWTDYFQVLLSVLSDSAS